MSTTKHLEVPVRGMDCTGCCQSVQRSIAALPGVESVDVLLAAEKAVVRFDPAQTDLAAIRSAVEQAGYTVPAAADAGEETAQPLSAARFTRAVSSSAVLSLAQSC